MGLSDAVCQTLLFLRLSSVIAEAARKELKNANALVTAVRHCACAAIEIFEITHYSNTHHVQASVSNFTVHHSATDVEGHFYKSVHNVLHTSLLRLYYLMVKQDTPF